MKPSCKWCDRTRLALPSGVLVCITCDLTPVSSIPNLKPKP